jgi:nucleoside-diphosphate-sugar epimerase
MEQAIATDAARGRTYLIADAHAVSIKTIVARIGEALGQHVRFIHVPFWPVYLAALGCEILYKPLPADPPIFRRRVDWFRQSRSFDISRAVRELGYAPAVDLPTGLAKTAEWYRRNGYL